MAYGIANKEIWVRGFIRGFLNSSTYRLNEASVALVDANMEAHSTRIWSGEFPDFMDMFYEEWDRKYPL
jgi:hypothetical protein